MTAVELPGLYIDDADAVVPAGRPVLINRDPCPDETGVPIDTSIAVEIVDPGTDGIDRAASRIWIDGVLAFEGGASPEITAGFSGPGAAVAQSADTLRVVLVPVLPFTSLGTVTVRVVSAVAGGIAAIDETYSFEIEDRIAPKVVAAQAMSPTTVRVSFDELVVVPSAVAFTFLPLDLPAMPLTVIHAVAKGPVVEVTLGTEMTPDVRYDVRIAGVTDLFDNVVLAPFDRAVFAGFRPARPPGRRFDLWSMLPRHNRRDDQTGDLRRFIACLQEVTDLLLAEADRFPDIFDLERAPEPFLDVLLTDLGNPFAFDLDPLAKRRLASVLVEMYAQKGTTIGIINAIRFFLGIEVAAIAAYSGEALVLGESELGVDWILGPSSRFARYAFDLRVNVVLTATQRRQIRAIVDYLKPAHTHFVDLIEPTPPLVFDHWELGISEMGLTTDLH